MIPIQAGGLSIPNSVISGHLIYIRQSAIHTAPRLLGCVRLVCRIMPHPLDQAREPPDQISAPSGMKTCTPTLLPQR